MWGNMTQRKAIMTTRERWKLMYCMFYKHDYEKLERLFEEEPNKEDK